MNEWLITLDVDDPFGLSFVIGFPLFKGGMAAQRSVGQVGVCHAGICTCLSRGICDAFVVCRHKHNVAHVGTESAFNDPLNDGFAIQLGQGLTRKSGGAPARWDDSDQDLTFFGHQLIS
jgi:hypothetical protein